MADDSELLLTYCRDRSERAFTELVGRYVNLVYFAALRQVGGDAHKAQDVSQAVFTQLALKAPRLLQRASIAGWLYNCTRYIAARMMRSEQRRLAREGAAQTMLEIGASPTFLIDWSRLEPVIDEVLHALNGRDRELVLLRYFQDKSFVEISSRLGLSADAARFRLGRALEKMRAGLARRGIKSTAAALGLTLSFQAEAAAPAGSAAATAATALAFASSAEASAFGLWRFLGYAKGAFSVSGALWIGALLCIPAIGSAIHEVRANRRAQAELAAANHQLEAETSQLRALVQKAQYMEQSRAKLLAADRSKNWDSRVEAQKFLRAFPQARDLFMEISKADALYSFAGFLRTSNLTPGGIEQFKDLIASTWVDNLVATHELIAADSGDPTFEHLREVLGDPGAKEFQNYEQIMQYPYRFTTEAAVAASETGTPLTDRQVDQLAQIIASNTGPHVTNPAGLDSGNWDAARDAVNWETAIIQARSVLSPQQFRGVESRLLVMQYNAALDHARLDQGNPQGKP